MDQSDTRGQIMAAAKARVQAHGYTALSFRELAKEVGIKSASIHYHFPTKGDLGAAIARRYTEDAAVLFAAALASKENPAVIFDHYLGVFRAALLNDNRLCLYGMMAAERDELPEEVRTEVDGFLQANVAWLEAMFARLTPGAAEEAVKTQALAMFAAIEGAQLVARSRNDIALFDRIIRSYRDLGVIPR